MKTPSLWQLWILLLMLHASVQWTPDYYWAYYSTASGPCLPNPCNNSGTCQARQYGGFDCTCKPGFEGPTCDVNQGLDEIKSLDMSNAVVAKGTINSTLGNIQSGATNLTSDLSAMNSYVDIVSATANKLKNASTWSESDKIQVGTEVIQTVGNLMSSLSMCDDACAQTTDVTSNVQSMENSVLGLGVTLTRNVAEADLEIAGTETMKVRYRKKPASEMVRQETETDGVKVKLPESLADRDATSALLLKMIAYGEAAYVDTSSSPDTQQKGKVILTRLEDEQGQSQAVDPADPILLTLEPPAKDASAAIRLADDSIWCMEWLQGQFLSAVFSLPPGKTLVLTGRFNEDPTDTIFDFSFTVTSSGVDVTHPYGGVMVVLRGGMAFLYVTDVAAKPRVCIRATYSGSAVLSGRRRLLAVLTNTSQTLNSAGLSVITWNTQGAAWSTDSGLQLHGVDPSGHVQFKSNFLGSFSLSEFVVVPTSIDFSDIFANFTKYLRDSPYVLSVIMALFVMTVVTLVFVRRLDKADTALWAYLPLVDNQECDMFVYTLSVHTALSSPRHVTVTPFFVLRGVDDVTEVRILHDGVRENFKSGTVSNFVMTSRINLGQLLELRIWHDNKGKKPNWKLDRVVVCDQTTQEITIFFCRDWLSTTKGDGKVSRQLPALNHDLSDGSEVFDMVSKQRLFDDHLWLSVARRPAYSPFTRVQRFVCAVALLFLTMVTNAMFYKGKEADREQLRGVELGPLQINYRQVFVGAVSALIVVVPTTLIAVSFKRRKIRGVTYPSFSSQPQSSGPPVVMATDAAASPLGPQHSEKSLQSQDVSNLEPQTEQTFSKNQNSLFSGRHPTKTVSFVTDKSDMTMLPIQTVSNKVSSKADPLAFNALSPREVQPQVETHSMKNKFCFDNEAFQLEMEGLERGEASTSCNQDDKGCGTRAGRTTLSATQTGESEHKDLLTTQKGCSTTRGGLNIPRRVNDSFVVKKNCGTNNEAKLESLVRSCPQTKSARGKSKLLLPWWFIFVGYAIAGLSMAAGAFFTFLYSLEWGGMTSLDWLLAFFFATSTGTFLLEPLKILFISVALSCIFRKLARDEISTVAPFTADRTQTWYPSQRGNSSPMPNLTADPSEAESKKELKERRQSMLLQRRMYGVLKSLTAQALYVALLFVICFQSNVRESFLQNEAVRNQMALGKLSTDVTSPSDVTEWLEKDFLQNVLPLTGFDGDVISVTRRRFLSDQSNFRLGPVTLTQYRVRGDCDLEDSVQSRLGSIHCVPLYGADSEETRTFSAGWTVCDQNCSDTAFLYDAGDELTIAQESRGEFYGPGGYRVSLDHTRRVAEVTLHKLRTDGWLDRYTRAVNVEMNLFNPNTRLFTQAKVLLRFPPSGSCLSVVSLRSARLYPYTTVWDYLLLVLQLIFVFVVIVRLCAVAKSVCFPPQGHGRCCDGVVVTLLELLLSLSAIVIYIVRIDRTILVLERVRNDPDIFTSWDVVFALDYVYRVCLSVCLFTRVLGLLGPLSFSQSLHVLHTTLMRSRPQLYGLALVAALLLTAFAAFFFLFEGPVTYRLRNFLQSYQTLLTVLLTMTKYNALRTDGGDRFQEAFHKVMYGFYCLVAAMMIMNFAITILTVYISDVRKMTSQGASRGDEGDLGQFIWSKLQSLVSRFPGRDRRLSLRAATRDKKTPAKAVDNLEELETKLEQMLGKLMCLHSCEVGLGYVMFTKKLEQMLGKLMPLHSSDDPWLRAAYEELHRTRNRLREVELEAERHRTQLSLLRKRVQLSDGVLNVDVSYSVGRTVIRIVDADYELLYVLNLTNENDTPVVTCTAEEVTKAAEDMDSDNYELLSKVVKLTFSLEEDFAGVEVGFPVKAGLPQDKQAVAVKLNDQMPWLCIPAIMESNDGMLWSRLQGLPLYLAAVVRADQTD